MRNAMNDTLGNTQLWFERAVVIPTTKNFHTQLGCHFEEVAEMVETLKGKDLLTQAMLTVTMVSLHSLALHLKASDNVVEVSDPVKMLDALCDQVVTAVGAGHMQGFPMLEAMAEVNRSNWSKFVDGFPIFDGNYKIQKGPGYSKAQLDQFIPASLD